ncbi:CbrC family protein, partial [Escherichia coli]|uniref:CbrC family protein n=1 Tax=Escherichia coli TaxID=562 RepID=UPI0013C316A2
DDVELIHDDNLEELLFRTPSYIAWQEPQWLSHCNEFCSFVRYLDRSELHDMRNDLQEGISLLKENYGLSVDQLGEDIGLYLF